jgi:hypothetical protein
MIAIENQLKNFTCLAETKEQFRQIMEQVGQGGARGLEVISLAECKNINDNGISQ